jgi:hypothetical protein
MTAPRQSRYQNDLLADQVAAAKEAFEHCKLKPTDEVFASINDRLDEGIVLPEYHAYGISLEHQLVHAYIPVRIVMW